MSDGVQVGRRAEWQIPVAVLAAALLFNLGQGVLRPTLPLYLQQVFAANYQMVTLIPLVFGAGKWVASLPTGYLLDCLERRRVMVGGLLVIASCDVGSLMTSAYGVFLGLRALAGVGWAMFGIVATAAMVNQPAAQRRGRAVSLLLMSETLGLLLGCASGRHRQHPLTVHRWRLHGQQRMDERRGWSWGMPMAVACRGVIRDEETVLYR